MDERKKAIVPLTGTFELPAQVIGVAAAVAILFMLIFALSSADCTVSLNGESYYIVAPGIEIEKRINGEDYLTAAPGETLEVTLWINNCGGVNLTELSVRDNFPLHQSNAGLRLTGNASPAADGALSGINGTGWIDFAVLWWGNIPAYPAGHLALFEPLQPGENFTITFEVTVEELAAGLLENCATVTATYTIAGNVTGTVDDTDCATVSVSPPGIEIEKRINGEDYLTAAPGETLEVTLWINNCGGVNLTELSVRDNFPLHQSNAGLRLTGNASPAADGALSGINGTGWIDFAVLWWGNIPAYPAGHLALFEPLQPGENFTITFEVTVEELAAGPLENCATVTATYTTAGNVTGTVDDTDCATVSVSLPSGNFITNIELTPPSPATLKFNEHVDITFDYFTNETGGIRIFVRPFTLGSLTPNYEAHGSSLYPVGTGSGSGWFTITSGAVTVDQLRLRMYNANQSTLLLEFFIPVEYHFGKFDTKGGSYPSISGTFTGTITPSRNLTVSTLYTYSCPGTGGHTEYVKIWKGSEVIAERTWDGYTGDWHNLSFNNSFTLFANVTYNYTIRTGSYPQIIHEPSWNATGGVITCEEFVDINGKRHEGWIPAIRLS